MTVSSKIPTKLFLDFCPEFFCSFLGTYYVISYTLHKESYRKPKRASKKPPGRYKKIQGGNPEIISLVFWKKLSFYEDVLKLTDL